MQLSVNIHYLSLQIYDTLDAAKEDRTWLTKNKMISHLHINYHPLWDGEDHSPGRLHVSHQTYWCQSCCRIWSQKISNGILVAKRMDKLHYHDRQGNLPPMLLLYLISCSCKRSKCLFLFKLNISGVHIFYWRGRFFFTPWWYGEWNCRLTLKSVWDKISVNIIFRVIMK